MSLAEFERIEELEKNPSLVLYDTINERSVELGQIMGDGFRTLTEYLEDHSPTEQLQNISSQLNLLSEEVKKKWESEISIEIDPETIRGPQGLPGPMGPMGMMGPMGPAGVIGPRGMDGISPDAEQVALMAFAMIELPDYIGPDEPGVTARKLETLKGDARLDWTAIKNIPPPQIIQENVGIPHGGLDFDSLSRTFASQSSLGNYVLKAGDTMTGPLNFTLALDNNSPIYFADSAGVNPTVYTMHVGGGEFSNTGGGIFNIFNIEFSVNSDSGSYNQLNFQNTTSFQIISHISASSFNIQEQNGGMANSTWTFASDQNMAFSSSAGNITFNPSQVSEGVQTLTSAITRSGQTATVTKTNHGVATGDVVLIAGADQADYNGYFRATRTSSSVFTIQVLNSPTTPSTGTITIENFPAAFSSFGAVFQDQDTYIYNSAGGIIFRTDGSAFMPRPTTASQYLSPGAIWMGGDKIAEPIAFLNILPRAFTAYAGKNAFLTIIDNNTTASVTIPTGTSPIIGGLYLDAPRFIMTGSSTNSPTFYVAGAPTKTSGAGTLGNPYAIWSDSGTNRLDDGVLLGGATGVAITATTGGVLTIASSGNTNNENLTLDFEGTSNKVILNTGTGVTQIQFNIAIEMNAKNIITDTTTGTQIATGTTQKLGFFGATPIVQQTTTSQTASTFVANTSGIVDDSATWDGYTVGDIVKILRVFGFIA